MRRRKSRIVSFGIQPLTTLSTATFSTLRQGEHAATRLLSVEFLEERTLFSLEGNELFPANNPWNQVVSAAPVAANSSTLVASIGAGSHLHPDFGTIYEGAYIGIPFVVVSASQPKVQVIVDAYPDESDLIDVPIPSGAPLEGDPLPSNENDGDRHLIVYDKDNNVAYELYNVHRPSETADGKWHADSIAYWDMDQNWFRTPGDTSADAAGLPILPGLVRPDEVLDQGVIDHALRFTVPRSRNQYVYPASHQAGVNNASYPRMGERFRLKADFDISGFSPANQVILQALKTYGMIVADNGSGWYLSGQPSSRWDDDELSELGDIIGSNFEAVDLRPIVNDIPADTGPTAGGTPVTISGLNFSGAAGNIQVYFGGVAATNLNVVSDSTLVVTLPAHAAGTVQVTVATPYGTSATSTNSQFTYTSGAGVVGRHVFYNQSVWDGNSAAINPASDNAAIAPDKLAYLPGSGVAASANATNFSRGINGIMVDLAPGGNHTAITAGDFVFKVGNNNSPSTWAAGPAPSAISVVSGGGTGGSDRVIITWPSGSIANKWLEVQVLANARTGLAAADVHFWGNKVADSASSSPAGLFETTSTDAAQVFGSIGAGKPISDSRDYNRDGQVTSTDAAITFANIGSIVRINIGGVPFSPVAESAEAVAADEAAIGFAITARGASGKPQQAQPRSALSPLSSARTLGPTSTQSTAWLQPEVTQVMALLLAVEELDDAAAVGESLLDALLAFAPSRMH
jgi:hypothetical protein